MRVGFGQLEGLQLLQGTPKVALWSPHHIPLKPEGSPGHLFETSPYISSGGRACGFLLRV